MKKYLQIEERRETEEKRLKKLEKNPIFKKKKK